MKHVIGSDAARQGMIRATNENLPALAGVDRLLQLELGRDYSADNEATVQAGYLVKGFMEGMGYELAGRAAMPAGCIAQTAATYRLKRVPE